MSDLEKPLGVQYTPSSTTSSNPLTVDALRTIYNIKYIRIQWVDLTNSIRHRILPLSYFVKILDSPRPGISIAKIVLGIVYLTVADGFGPCEEYLYVPDLTTLRICTYAPGHASVMGWFEEKLPNLNVDKALVYQVDLCPRTILHRIIDNAKSSLGLDFLVGFETEFILLNSISPIKAVNEEPWCAAQAFRSNTIEAIVLEEIMDALLASGIEVQMLHSEAAPGQYEIVTGPLRPLQAADALIHTRETIYNIARRHGLYATLAPRVFPESCGSAAHTHISIHSDKHSPASAISTDLTEVQASFLASILEHLPALIALTLPIPESFKRVVDGAWSGGTYVCWGTDNREAPVRLCNASSPSSRNFEFKTVDGTANPYLVLAGILGTGIDGIRNKTKLDIKDCTPHEPGRMGESQRQTFGIKKRLPLRWEEARDNFEKDETLSQLFGQNFLRKYLSVNKTLADSLASIGEDDALARLLAYY